MCQPDVTHPDVRIGHVHLRAGESLVVPKDALHRFHNATDDTVTFLCEMRPGQPGFEKTIVVAYGLARDGLTRPDGTPKNLYHMALLLDWAGIRVPGFFTLVEPLMRLLARRARRKGIDGSWRPGTAGETKPTAKQVGWFDHPAGKELG